MVYSEYSLYGALNPYLQPQYGSAQPMYYGGMQSSVVAPHWEQPATPLFPVSSPSLYTQSTPQVQFSFTFEDYGVSQQELQVMLNSLDAQKASMFNDLQLKKVQIAQGFQTLAPNLQQEALVLFNQARLLQVDLLGLKKPAQTASTTPVQSTAPTQPVANQPVPNSPANSSVDPNSFVPVTSEPSQPVVAQEPQVPTQSSSQPVAVEEPQVPTQSPSQPVAVKEPQTVTQTEPLQPVTQPVANEVVATAQPETPSETVASEPASSLPSKWEKHPLGGPPGLVKQGKVPPGHQDNRPQGNGKSKNEEKANNTQSDSITFRFEGFTQALTKHMQKRG